VSHCHDMVTEHQRHQAERKRLMEAIAAEVQALPDNPRIKRLPGNPHCFIARSKDVFASGNLTPEHHDFKRQYELVVDEISKAADPIEFLRHILTEGKVRLSRGATGCPHATLRLHPDVVNHLSRMGGFRWQSVAHWPAGTISSAGDISDDTHDTRSQAEAVCNLLKAEGFGGNRRVFPKATRVEAVLPVAKADEDFNEVGG